MKYVQNRKRNQIPNKRNQGKLETCRKREKERHTEKERQRETKECSFTQYKVFEKKKLERVQQQH